MNLSATLLLFTVFATTLSFSATPTDYREFFTPRLKEACLNVKVGTTLGDHDYDGQAEAWLENYNRRFSFVGGSWVNLRATAKQPESLCIAVERLGEQQNWTQEVIEQEMNQMLKKRSSLIPGSRLKNFMAHLVTFIDNTTPDTYAKFQRRKNA